MTISTTADLAVRGVHLVIDLIDSITDEAEQRGNRKAASLIRQATAKLETATEQICKAQALLPDVSDKKERCA